MREMTPEERERLEHGVKGFTRALLEELGVPYPWPKGWRMKLLGRVTRTKGPIEARIAFYARMVKSRAEAIENAADMGNREDLQLFLNGLESHLVELRTLIKNFY